MYGTLYGALEARKIAPLRDSFKAEVEGRIEAPNPREVLRITEITVHYHFPVPAGKKAEAERALAVHASACEAYQSVKDAIRISWKADIGEE